MMFSVDGGKKSNHSYLQCIHTKVKQEVSLKNIIVEGYRAVVFLLFDLGQWKDL